MVTHISFSMKMPRLLRKRLKQRSFRLSKKFSQENVSHLNSLVLAISS
ncbi:Conserved hypothetical protein [Ligilactobacillus ruminis ATCC 27782]|uniref:Uncharacterized protein n=1 Tax=Ligilactobacillus ruminis (strain ATCC 27782 / RF3) TaxID=1069534 RepID=G2SLS8_LIGR2|nr:Conserved hypothetical protein [Ligilactobacillus ruminis ATCC 27782]